MTGRASLMEDPFAARAESARELAERAVAKLRDDARRVGMERQADFWIGALERALEQRYDVDERVRLKMIESFDAATEGRDAYADGYASGLIAAMQEIRRAE